MVLLGPNWIGAQLNSTDGGRVSVTVIVTVGVDEDVAGSDLSASLKGDSTTLSLISGPDASPLRVINETTAFASFVFDNPQNLTPGTLTVTFRGQSTDLSLTPAGS
jgi:hypothetical protein